jgi:F-box protein 16
MLRSILYKVCWYWKTLTELDILWMPKCLRFNWILNYKPTPFETGIWKRYYIENIRAIQYVPTKVSVFFYESGL